MKELMKAASIAERKNDRPFFEQRVCEDFVFVSASGEARGKDEFVDYIADGGVTDLRPYNQHLLRIDDKNVLETHDVVIQRNPHSVGPRRYQRVTTLWVKSGDSWRLKFRQITPNLWGVDPDDLDASEKYPAFLFEGGLE